MTTGNLTIQDNDTVRQYTSVGETDFVYDFPILANSELKVSINQVRLIYGAEFTIAGLGDDGGGTVSIVGGTIAGDLVTVWQDMPIERLTGFSAGAATILGTALNSEFAARLRVEQQLRREIRNSFRLPPDDPVSGQDMELGPAADRANKFLAFDADGAPQFAAGVATLGAIPIPVAIASGGTGASSAGGALVNLGLIDVANEVNITAASSLDASALGHSFVLGDGGVPANFQVDLPNGAPIGSLIQFRVSLSATKLYTLAGVDVGLDNQASRILWRGESCLLMREAGNWAKLGGRTIPFRGCLNRTAAQAGVVAATFTPAVMLDEVGDTYNLDLCLDLVNGRFKAPRMGSYIISGNLSIVATVTIADAVADIALAANSAVSSTSNPHTFDRRTYQIGAARVTLHTAGVFSLNTNDFVDLLGRITAGGGGTATVISFEHIAATVAPTLCYAEVPLW